MLKKMIFGAALLCLSALSSLAVAHGYTVGDLEIKHPWSRASAAGATNAGVFMTLNAGSDEQLIHVAGDVAERVELHEMKMVDGMMKMRQVNALALAAKSETKLAPGSYHIMLLGLKAPLKEGDKFPITLTFAKAGTVTVQVKVESMTYQASATAHATH